MTCKCGSYAINLNSDGRDESNPTLCDVCHWKSRLTASEQRERVLREALDGAARSLKTISEMAGKDEYMSEFSDVRGYAKSRSEVANQALTATDHITDVKMADEYKRDAERIVMRKGYCSDCNNNPEESVVLASRTNGKPCNGCWFSDEKANWVSLNGKQYYSDDGTLMNADGTRSIFDDVDQ